MVIAIVTFSLGDKFDEHAVRQIAATASDRFRGMPGLRSKAFTVNAARREAVNVYAWESEAAAQQFYTEQMLERVTGLYGVRPRIEILPVAAFVDNAAA